MADTVDSLWTQYKSLQQDYKQQFGREIETVYTVKAQHDWINKEMNENNIPANNNENDKYKHSNYLFRLLDDIYFRVFGKKLQTKADAWWFLLFGIITLILAGVLINISFDNAYDNFEKVMFWAGGAVYVFVMVQSLLAKEKWIKNVLLSISLLLVIIIVFLFINIFISLMCERYNLWFC